MKRATSQRYEFRVQFYALTLDLRITKMLYVNGGHTNHFKPRKRYL